MDQLANPMTVRAEERGKGGENIGDENCTLVNEGIQSEATAGGRKLSAILEYEPGEANTDTGSQKPRECDSSSSSLFTMEKFTRRPSSSSSYTTESLASSQTDTGVDCASIVLSCLFCRFYDLLLMLPGSCERATFRCCPTYKHFSTAVESAPSNDSPTNLDFDCGLLEACQDTGDCLELAMEISEICYH